MNIVWGEHKFLTTLLTIAALVLILLWCSGCDLPPTQKDNLKADALRDAAHALVMVTLKDDPKLKKQLTDGAGEVLKLLDSGLYLTQKHWQLLLAKVNNPEYKKLAGKLVELLKGYVKYLPLEPDKLFSRREMLFIRAFFEGVKAGAQ